MSYLRIWLVIDPSPPCTMAFFLIIPNNWCLKYWSIFKFLVQLLSVENYKQVIINTFSMYFFFFLNIYNFKTCYILNNKFELLLPN